MKRILVLGLLAGILPGAAWAELPGSAITSMKISIYGIYMTEDPTCQTGLIPTVPLQATATEEDLSQNPVLGSGPIPAAIQCVIMVMQDHFTGTVAPGTYTTTSIDWSGSTVPDSNCNSGGTYPQYICQGDTVSWPSAIQADAAKVGLTLTTGSCPNPATGSEVIPAYLSTYSACTGQQATDPAACQNNDDNFTPPTAANDTSHGLKLTEPSTAGDFKFVINPNGAFGATGASTCGDLNPPQFSFVAK